MGSLAEQWPDARVARLKELWDEGLNSSQIAYRMNREFEGAGYTRSAILGKASRLGLSRPREKPEPVAKPKLMKKPRRIALTPEAQEIPEIVLPIATRTGPVIITELQSNDCRWPSGGEVQGAPIYFACCDRKLAGFSYCATHFRMMLRYPGAREAA